MTLEEFTLARPLPKGVGAPTQYFGEHPEFYARWGMDGHNGIDYGCPEGSQVLAAHDGRCVLGFDPKGFGCYIKVINDATGVATIYAHLSAFLRVDGEMVKEGDLIANSGNTGVSTGPHLHFGVRVAGHPRPATYDYLDPLPMRQRHGDA
jgi:murein DD-endopeptidase MepM/ murein hydrolase activator NlpD